MRHSLTASPRKSRALALAAFISILAVARGQNTVTGSGASAAGTGNSASGTDSTSFGKNNTASQQDSAAFGFNNLASGAQPPNTAYTILGQSTAFGVSNQATAKSSSAIGKENSASAWTATAIGYRNNASGKGASAFGYRNIASLDQAVAFGWGNTANGNWSVAFGARNILQSPGSIALGITNMVLGGGSVTVGRENNTGGGRGVAFGVKNSTNGEDAMAAGLNNVVSGKKSVGIGRNNTISSVDGLSLGSGNVVTADNSGAVGWNLTNNIAGSLMIGPSDTAKVTILSSGYVGVGTSGPTQKLDVAGAGVDTFVHIGSTGRDKGIIIQRDNNGSEFLRIAGAADGTGVTGKNNLYLFDRIAPSSPTMRAIQFRHSTDGGATFTNDMIIDAAGNLGIGTTAPATPLDVNGTIRGNTLQLNQPSLKGVLLGTDSSGNLQAATLTSAQVAPALAGSALTPASIAVTGGTISGGSTGLTLSAGASGQNVTIAPGGTGVTNITGNASVSGVLNAGSLQIGGTAFVPANYVLKAGDTFTGNVKLAAGTTTLAPLTLQIGTGTNGLTTTPVTGALEFDGANLFVTNNQTPSPARKPLAYVATTLAGYGITDGVSTSGTYTNPSWITSLAASKLDFTGGPLPAAALPALSGDVTSSAGSTTLNINNSVAGAGAGQHTKVTVNTKGLVTSTADLSASDIGGLLTGQTTNLTGTSSNLSLGGTVTAGNVVVSGLTGQVAVGTDSSGKLVSATSALDGRYIAQSATTISTQNLTATQALSGGSLAVSNNATIGGNATITGTLTVAGAAFSPGGYLSKSGDTMSGSLTAGALTATGAVAGASLNVSGATALVASGGATVSIGRQDNSSNSVEGAEIDWAAPGTSYENWTTDVYMHKFRIFNASSTSDNTNQVQIFNSGSGSTGLYVQGAVGVGIMNPGIYKLAVAGSIHAQEVVVDMTGWSDYVFDEHYKLAPLSEVEKTIKEEKHLPGIPSAQQVAEQGISLGEMQAKLLAKIEELTLHQIEQEKRLAAQAEQLASQSTVISAQAARIQRLESGSNTPSSTH